MDNTFGGQGTTLDGDTGQTREIMHDSAQAVVPKLSHEMQKAPDRLTTISAERKREIETESKRKIQAMEREYWAMRNEKQDHMACPYCTGINVVDQTVCCRMFAKALKAIMERQYQIDVAAEAARSCHKIGLVH